MSEVSEKISQQLETMSVSKLNSQIAVIVAIAASLVTIFNIKDNNIVQAMTQAQAHGVDAWAYYQAKSTKQHLAENTRDQLELMLMVNEQAKPAAKVKIEGLLNKAKENVLKYEKDKAEIKAQAEGYQREYDEINIRDDQFDLAEALISLSLSIFGITALTQKKPLFYFGLGLCSLGIIFGLAGFLGWNIHPDWLTRILG
jgi:hypothetical protein